MNRATHFAALSLAVCIYALPDQCTADEIPQKEMRLLEQAPDGRVTSRTLTQEELTFVKSDDGPIDGHIENSSDQPILVYGPKPAAGYRFDNALYILPAGTKTPEDFDYDGVFLPSDRTADGREEKPPFAAKISSDKDGEVTGVTDSKYTIKVTRLGFPVSFDVVVQGTGQGKVNWAIPSKDADVFTQSQITQLAQGGSLTTAYKIK